MGAHAEPRVYDNSMLEEKEKSLRRNLSNVGQTFGASDARRDSKLSPHFSSLSSPFHTHNLLHPSPS
ncbi:hypothetical protein TNCT_315171 [Trichonephila clavata]|uniref:Uncharacterized protein n=1 Tax=Trichonephila clavata TaxID=2740835 RepID=A0A8X6LTR5_TRICU|nr:hypothetical protein TNCT_315171 [Trichonephila clavata]